MIERGHDELVRLREAFFSEDWERSTEDCPDSERLWASAAGEMEPAEDEEILLHLARCGRCASIWRLAREMIFHDEAAFAPVIPMEEGKRARVWRWPALLAAAAMVVIGVGLGTGLLLNHVQPLSQPVYRQQGETVKMEASPETRRLPRTVCRLRWATGPEGTRYDLTVTGKDLTIICVVKGLTKPEYLLPPEEIPASTHEIFWRVTAHFPGGDVISSETFTSRIED